MSVQAANSHNHIDNVLSGQIMSSELAHDNNTQNKECRICFSRSEDTQNLLISPCSCSGSIKYVHHNCLKQWIERVIQKKIENQEDYEKIECQLCKTFIQFTMVVSRECRGWNQFKEKVRQDPAEFALWMFCLLISITLLIFSIVQMSLIVVQGFNSVDMVQKAVIFSAFVISIVGCIYLAYSSRKFFIKKKAQIKFQNRQA